MRIREEQDLLQLLHGISEMRDSTMKKKSSYFLKHLIALLLLLALHFRIAHAQVILDAEVPPPPPEERAETPPPVPAKQTYVKPVKGKLVSGNFGYSKRKTRAVTIGTQVWITKNLNVDHFTNGDSIPESRTAEEWRQAGQNKQPAWCYYNNDPANGTVYGKLYNWYVVADPRGLCPVGWHVPSDSEWEQLVNYAGVSNVGTKLKAANFRGSNTYGFSALPGGDRNFRGKFCDVGLYGAWWSSSEVTNLAWFRDMDLGYGLQRFNNFKDCGFSVRCLRD